jgi:hypothetical protein
VFVAWCCVFRYVVDFSFRYDCRSIQAAFAHSCALLASKSSSIPRHKPIVLGFLMSIASTQVQDAKHSARQDKTRWPARHAHTWREGFLSLRLNQSMMLSCQTSQLYITTGSTRSEFIACVTESLWRRERARKTNAGTTKDFSIPLCRLPDSCMWANKREEKRHGIRSPTRPSLLAHATCSILPYSTPFRLFKSSSSPPYASSPPSQQAHADPQTQT